MTALIDRLLSRWPYTTMLVAAMIVMLLVATASGPR